MAICAVIFDLDGVLIDSGPAHRQSWRALGAELGIEVSDQAVGAFFGRQNRDIVPILSGDDRTPQEVRRLGARKEELYRDLVRGNVPVNEGAVELVRYYLAGGYHLAVGSSTPRANIDLALGEMGIAELFGAIVSSEDVSVGKPDPTLFLTAASGAPPAVETRPMVQESTPEHDAAQHRTHWNIWVTKKEFRIPSFGTRILKVIRRGRDSNPRYEFDPV